MNRVVITAFTLFLCLGMATPRVFAQDDPPTATEATGNSDNEEPRLTVEWTELQLELAPLEEVTLPEPQLTLGTNGERQTYLQIGEPAPWAGVLLNPAAVAFIISEYRASFQRAQAALDRQRESDWNRLRLEVGQLRLQIETDRRQADVVIDGLRREVDRQIQIHEDYIEEQNGGFWNTDFGQVLQWGLVIIGSAAVGVVVGYLAASL